MMRESLRALPLWVLYGFLYLPILVVVGMSFNANDSAYRWTGFSLQWYPELLRDASILGGLRTTLIVAVGTTAISVVLGTLLAMALERYVPSRALDAAAAAPAVMPDIMLAIGLLALYTLVGIALRFSPIPSLQRHARPGHQPRQVADVKEAPQVHGRTGGGQRLGVRLGRQQLGGAC